MKKKLCLFCRQKKSVELFEKSEKSQDGYRHDCKTCQEKLTALYNQQPNPLPLNCFFGHTHHSEKELKEYRFTEDTFFGVCFCGENTVRIRISSSEDNYYCMNGCGNQYLYGEYQHTQRTQITI